jgi:hypothetical protein
VEGWAARVAWLVGVVAVLALAWERRRWRRPSPGAPPGARVARHRLLSEAANGWPWLALTGLLLIANGASIASRDPTDLDRVIGRVGSCWVRSGSLGPLVACSSSATGTAAGQGEGPTGTPPPDSGRGQPTSCGQLLGRAGVRRQHSRWLGAGECGTFAGDQLGRLSPDVVADGGADDVGVGDPAGGDVRAVSRPRLAVRSPTAGMPGSGGRPKGDLVVFTR